MNELESNSMELMKLLVLQLESKREEEKALLEYLPFCTEIRL